MKEKHFSTWRYLRFIAVFMLLYPISVLAAQGHISVKGQFSLKEAIQFIEKNSEYTFFYKDSDLRDNTKKNINCSGTIEEVLKKLFTDSGVNYIIKGNEVIFKVNKTEKVEQQQQQKDK